MNTLIILSALPGSGKTTWAKKYFEQHPNTYILSADEVRFEVTNSYDDFSRQKKVWKIINHRLKKLMKAKDATIIVDALNDTNLVRMEYITDFPKFDKYVLVFMSKEKSQLEYHNAERPKNRRVPETIMKMLYDRFENISEEVRKTYDEIVEINDYL